MRVLYIPAGVMRSHVTETVPLESILDTIGVAWDRDGVGDHRWLTPEDECHCSSTFHGLILHDHRHYLGHPGLFLTDEHGSSALFQLDPNDPCGGRWSLGYPSAGINRSYVLLGPNWTDGIMYLDDGSYQWPGSHLITRKEDEDDEENEP